MPTKGQVTRRNIVSRASRLFNTRGYAGTSIADILDATGLEKGGLYRHFRSKDEVALAAFEHAVELLRKKHHQASAAAASPLEAVVAWIESVAESVRAPAVPGGCPILNTATEADDTHPALRAKAAAALREWQTALASLLQRAIDHGQLHAERSPTTMAATIVCALEGAIMATALLRDDSQMQAVADHLQSWLRAHSS